VGPYRGLRTLPTHDTGLDYICKVRRAPETRPQQLFLCNSVPILGRIMNIHITVCALAYTQFVMKFDLLSTKATLHEDEAVSPV